MQKIWLVGCGRMGSAMLMGWIKDAGDKSFVIVDHHNAYLKKQFQQSYVVIYNSITHALEHEFQADVIIFALKPYHIEDVLKATGEKLSKMNPLFMTIIAGKPMTFYESYLGADCRLIRTMPNTPGAIGKGITGAVLNKNANDLDRLLCEQLYQPLGEMIWGEGDLFLDKVTAVSGSGPAYVFLFMEAMVEKAIDLGIDEVNAKKMVLQTVLGAAQYAKISEDSLAQLRSNVTSPNGTTHEAIKIFEESSGNLRSLLSEGMQACYDRSVAIGRE